MFRVRRFGARADADPEIMGVKGSEPRMSANDGISGHGDITAFAESPVARGLLYVGTDDGNVQVSRDDGATWSAEMMAAARRVFPPARESIMWAERGDWPFQGPTCSAPDPPRGARIRCYLRDEWEAPVMEEGGGEEGDGNGAAAESGAGDGDDVGAVEPAGSAVESSDADGENPGGATFSLTITDADGNRIRTLEAPSGAGVNTCAGAECAAVRGGREAGGG